MVLIGSDPLTHSVTAPQVPTDYFLRCLGKRLKYSSCLYPHAETTLDEAEEAMLRESCPETAACRPSALPYIPESTNRCLTQRPHIIHQYTAGLYCERAQLKDGQTVLELGCGWGSLCLYLAEQYPRSEITAVSNSRSQKQLIMQRAKDRRLKNLKVCCSVAQLTLRTEVLYPSLYTSVGSIRNVLESACH